MNVVVLYEVYAIPHSYGLYFHYREQEVQSCIVVQHLTAVDECQGHSTEGKRPYNDLSVSMGPIDSWFHEETANCSDVCEPEWVDSEDPLFLLYTR